MAFKKDILAPNRAGIEQMQIVDRGAIASMNLPDGWHLGAEERGVMGNGSSIRCSPADEKDVELTFFERGQLFRSAGPTFKAMLSLPSHRVTADEFEALGPLLGNYLDSRAFEVDFCQTEILNGRTVLIIQGTWRATKHKSLSILVASDDSAQQVQEIYYKAPHTLFEKFYPQCMAALQTICWKA